MTGELLGYKVLQSKAIKAGYPDQRGAMMAARRAVRWMANKYRPGVKPPRHIAEKLGMLEENRG